MIVTYQDNFGRISSDAPTMYIYAQNFTVYGDTLYETQSHKIRRVMDLVCCAMACPLSNLR